MNDERIERNPVRWEPAAAFACFVGSVLSLVVGFVLTTEWILNAQRHSLLHGLGLALLIVGIPILILGGHCLDLMEKKARKSTRELHGQGNGRAKPLHVVIGLVGFLSFLCVAPVTLNAQQTGTVQSSVPTSNIAVAPTVGGVFPDASERERILLTRIDQLEKRLATVESRLASSADAGSNGSINSESGESKADAITSTSLRAGETGRSTSKSDRQNNPSDDEALGFLRDTTFNLTLVGLA